MTQPLGSLADLDMPPAYVAKRRYDWRLGVSRQFGRFGVHLDVSGRIEGRARYWIPYGPGSGRDRTAVVASLTRAF